MVLCLIHCMFYSSVYVHTCLHSSMYVHSHPHSSMYVHTCLHSSMYVHTSTFFHVCSYLSTFFHVCPYLFLHVCPYLFLHVLYALTFVCILFLNTYSTYTSYTFIQNVLFSAGHLKALENEITIHEGQCQEVMKEATQLLTSGHFATSSIREKNSELQKCWMELKNLAAGRRHMLNDAMEAQRVCGWSTTHI